MGNFRDHLQNAPEECKAILKYNTKANCMSRNSSKASNENQQEMLFWPKFDQKWVLGLEFQKSKSAIFQRKRTVFIFSAQICPKTDLGLEI